MTNEWSTPQHAAAYLARMNDIPHRVEGEATLLAEIATTSHRILDLGCGDGHLLSLALSRCSDASGVGVDFSPTMLTQARERFANDDRVELVNHDLDHPLPEIGEFDCVISSFAIHHCTDERKRALYQEIFARLRPEGVFCNLEHVASPDAAVHQRFVEAMGMTAADEDPSNKLLDVETQLRWLRDIGFVQVDCFWKWRELALLVGRRPKDCADAADLVIDQAPTVAEVDALGLHLESYNLAQVGIDDEKTLNLVIRERGKMVAGMRAITGWDWLYVQTLWVDQDQRRRGLGSRLLDHAEREAQSRGCIGSCLSTFDFQAPGFYARHGYDCFGQIDRYPGEHTMYFLSKLFEK